MVYGRKCDWKIRFLKGLFIFLGFCQHSIQSLDLFLCKIPKTSFGGVGGMAVCATELYFI